MAACFLHSSALYSTDVQNDVNVNSQKDMLALNEISQV